MKMQSCKCDFCLKELFDTDYHGEGWVYPTVHMVGTSHACADCAWNARELLKAAQQK